MLNGFTIAVFTIKPGAGGWIAVISGQHLSMWQIRNESILVPYSEHQAPLIVGIHPDKFTTTTDGKYLLASTGEKAIATWVFPKFAYDEG